MARIKICELANEIGVKSSNIINYISQVGGSEMKESSLLDERQAERIRKVFRERPYAGRKTLADGRKRRKKFDMEEAIRLSDSGMSIDAVCKTLGISKWNYYETCKEYQEAAKLEEAADMATEKTDSAEIPYAN